MQFLPALENSRRNVKLANRNAKHCRRSHTWDYTDRWAPHTAGSGCLGLHGCCRKCCRRSTCRYWRPQACMPYENRPVDQRQPMLGRAAPWLERRGWSQQWRLLGTREGTNSIRNIRVVVCHRAGVGSHGPCDVQALLDEVRWILFKNNDFRTWFEDSGFRD